MPEQPLQRCLVEVQAAPREVVAGWLAAGELQSLLAGRDPAGPLPSMEFDREPAPVKQGSADLGARGSLPPTQLTREHLRSMSSAAIVQAEREGRLDQLLGR